MVLFDDETLFGNVTMKILNVTEKQKVSYKFNELNISGTIDMIEVLKLLSYHCEEIKRDVKLFRIIDEY